MAKELCDLHDHSAVDGPTKAELTNRVKNPSAANLLLLAGRGTPKLTEPE